MTDNNTNTSICLFISRGGPVMLGTDEQNGSAPDPGSAREGDPEHPAEYAVEGYGDEPIPRFDVRA